MASLLINGLLTGILFALAGMGLVVIYKASGVLNFAHGIIAALVAYIALTALTDWGIPYPFVILGAILVGAATGLLIQQLVIRPLGKRAALTLSVATIGVWLALKGIVVALFGSQIRAFPPFAAGSITLGSVQVSYHQLFAVTISILVATTLFIVFQRTRVGRQLRATYENPYAAQLMGINIRYISSLTWSVSGALSGLAGVLLAPQYRLSAEVMDQILIAGFVAVVIGGLNSFAGAAVGGIILGIAQNLGAAYISTTLKTTILFGLLLIILAIRPQGILGRKETLQKLSGSRRLGGDGLDLSKLVPKRLHVLRQRRFRRVLMLIPLVIVVILPIALTGATLSMVTVTMVMVPAVLSLTVLTGFAGEISLGQAGFMAAGAYTTVLLDGRFSLPGAIIVILAVLVGCILGVLVALPSVRLSGLQFAVATLGFGWAAPEILLNSQSFAGGYAGLSLDATSIVGIPIGYGHRWGTYVVAVGFLVLSVFFVHRIRASALGRRLRAVRDSEPGAVALGISPVISRIVAVALSAGLASFAGSGYAYIVGYVAPQGFLFIQSVFLIVALVVGGSEYVSGAVIGAIFVTVIPFYTSGMPQLSPIILGLLLFVAIALFGTGIAGSVLSIASNPVQISVDSPKESHSKTMEAVEADVVE